MLAVFYHRNLLTVYLPYLECLF